LPLPGPDHVKFGSETLTDAVGASRKYQRCQDACMHASHALLLEGAAEVC
jgi:hypothetical protein